MFKKFLFILTISMIMVGGSKAFAVTDTLDYGLYWFNSSNQSVKAYNETTGTVLSVPTSYYSNSKKTVIFFHGWQKDSCSRNYEREHFYFYDSGENIDEVVIDQWKQDGWNVGIFHWNQFADENEVKDAEAKLWSANGNRGMRYRLSDGSYRTTYSPNVSVSDLAYNQITACLANNNSGVTRMVGHSLGNQIATIVSYKINNAVDNGTLGNQFLVERLDLIDPFWSKWGKSYLGGDWTGERVRSYIDYMINRDDIAVTWYKTTAILNLGIGDSNSSMEGKVAFVKPKYWYLSFWQIADKHVYAASQYFWSYEGKPALYNKNGNYIGDVGPSALSTDDEIRGMMGSQYYYDQIGGRYTPDPSDDEYKSK